MQIIPNTTTNSYGCKTNKSQSFTSRNAIIRKLDKINRITRREFPVYSSTMLVRKGTNSAVRYKLFSYAGGLIDELRGFSKSEAPKDQVMLRSLDAVKELGVGNCSELADAGYVACRLNGVKDAKIFSLCVYDEKTDKLRELDHVMVGINFKNPQFKKIKNCTNLIYGNERQAVIMDPWAGFVDYADNASAAYKRDEVFGKTLKPTEKVCYTESIRPYQLSKGKLLYLAHQYPGLMGGKKLGFLDRLRWKLMDKTQFEYRHICPYLKETYKRNAGLKSALPQDKYQELLTGVVNQNAELERLEIERQNKLQNLLFSDFREKFVMIRRRLFG